MNYKYIIPLGEECYTAGSIDNKFNSLSTIRKEAYPFDYVGHVFIESILKKLQCEEMCDTNKFEEMENYSNNTVFFVDKEYDFRYWHDSTNKDEVISKYNRRYNRLFNAINSSESILFISVQHFDRIYANTNNKDNLIKLYEFIKAKNNNIDMIAFNYCNQNFNHDTLKHNNITINTNLEFKIAKEYFTKQLFDIVNKYTTQ